ncbi:TetR/AcrR family transcriptional regulator C-terminal domain-containing protein [Streptomyces sp. ID05-39B]|uniref:TetR/AcrR family transcriptional regulator n=1 Tax=Streptomyces sp. ID05-39B TaxID=3028664 RepID=UPI0029AD046F|nr:TetR/AcrR family transcriptional regulator C-terminal domain-containing protein [Streptomyces sp. ID05-39B]MDX3525580.1 TetR/AcrR family transcriptional regulator C-terminal domain-containing protein [Streptomyces sp. ID05-39B]
MKPRNGRRGGARQSAPLSQETIVAAALHILDSEGPQQLSMRRLARELSITPMALYHHVRDRHELLLLLVASRSRGHDRPILPEDPRERLLAAAQLLHDVLARYPFLHEILASPDLLAVSALWVMEALLDAAVECGLPLEEAAQAHQAIWHYTVGVLLIRTTSHQHHAELTRPTQRERAFATLSPDDFPRVTSLADRWSSLTARDTHREALEDIVEGLLRGRPAHPGEHA